jgi:VWFA-related protein
MPSLNRKKTIFVAAMAALLLGALTLTVKSQPPQQKGQVRPVTIPISIFTRQELKQKQAEEFVSAERLVVREDNEEQEILSIRSVGESTLSIALLIQEDLASGFNLQIKEIQEFIRGLPKGSRVMVAYARSGSLQVTQRFTDDVDAAAKSIHIVAGNPSMAPRSPFESLEEVLSRFDATPTGRRAVLLFSDGLDTTAGLNLASISQSLALDQAILKAQRRSVAVYSFYSPTTLTEGGNSTLVLGAQGALQKLADETGGRAFFQGSIAPISFVPFFKDLNLSLNRQFALTYLSTHMKKGYHKVRVESTNPEVRIEHPRGYYYR